MRTALRRLGGLIVVTLGLGACVVGGIDETVSGCVDRCIEGPTRTATATAECHWRSATVLTCDLVNCASPYGASGELELLGRDLFLCETIYDSGVTCEIQYRGGRKKW